MQIQNSKLKTQNSKLILLLLFIALANFSFAQVQIEEEVVLDDEINIDAEFLTMPFFGIIEGSANGGALYHGLLKLVGISAGDQSVARGVSTCSASWQASAGWDIQNVAGGTPVIVRAYICDNGSPAQYVETATEKIVTGVNKYTIRFQDRNGAWRDATTLEFTEQDPCLTEDCCDDLPICEYQEPNTVDTVGIESQAYTYYDIDGNPKIQNLDCPTNAAASSTQVPWHIPANYQWDIQPCYNGETGKVDFPLNFNIGSNSTKTIPFVYLFRLCPIPGITLIDNTTSMQNDLNSGIITSSDYCNLIKDICNANKHPVPELQYRFKDIKLLHERIHAGQYYNLLDDYLNQNVVPILKDLTSVYCSAYINNPGILDDIKRIYFGQFLKTYSDVIALLPAANDSKNEELIQNDCTIEELAYGYYKVFRDYLDDNSITFPPSNCVTNVYQLFETRFIAAP